MAKETNNPIAVTEYIARLDPSFGKLIQAIREIILATDKNIGEHIKWNSPSFFYTGEMEAFDPKEYKRDLLVINVRKEQALLVLPTGANIKDTTGILEGKYTDGRRMITIKSFEELHTKSESLKTVIQLWLNQVK